MCSDGQVMKSESGNKPKVVSGSVVMSSDTTSTFASNVDTNKDSTRETTHRLHHAAISVVEASVGGSFGGSSSSRVFFNTTGIEKIIFGSSKIQRHQAFVLREFLLRYSCAMWSAIAMHADFLRHTALPFLKMLHTWASRNGRAEDALSRIHQRLSQQHPPEKESVFPPPPEKEKEPSSWVLANRTLYDFLRKAATTTSGSNSVMNNNNLGSRLFQVWDTETGFTPHQGLGLLPHSDWMQSNNKGAPEDELLEEEKQQSKQIPMHSRVRGELSMLLDRCTQSVAFWRYRGQGETRMIAAEDDIREVLLKNENFVHPDVSSLLQGSPRLTPLLRRLHSAVCRRLRVLKAAVASEERVLGFSSFEPLKGAAPPGIVEGEKRKKHVRLLLTAWSKADIVRYMRPIQLWRCYAKAQGYEFVAETNAPSLLLTEVEKTEAEGLLLVRGETNYNVSKAKESATLARLNRGGDVSARLPWFRLRWWKIREHLTGVSGKTIPDVIITGIQKNIFFQDILS